ncbi:MAG: cytochrome c-type biogenesis protein CcmH [Gemmatimonadaceae bacterium]
MTRLRAANGELRLPAWRATVPVVVAAVLQVTPVLDADAMLVSPRVAAQVANSLPRRGAGPADSTLELLTRQVAAQLRCPVCQGLSLADSPSELALEMKDVVREQLRAGRTPDEVKGYFVAKYGEWILLEPPRRGFNLLAYLLPAGAIVAGLGVVWLALHRWTDGAPPAEEVPRPDLLD